MCHCDLEGPAAYRAVTRRARKAHRCCECRVPIAPGTTYVYASGIWDGRPESFAVCTDCTALKKEWSEVASAHSLCPPCWEIGSLHEGIFEWVEEAEHTLMDRERQAAYARRNATVVMAVSP